MANYDILHVKVKPRRFQQQRLRHKNMLAERGKMIVVSVRRAMTLMILLLDTKKDDRDTRAARYDIDDLID